MSERSEALKASHVRRMAEWFEGRRWRVCSELNTDQQDILVKNGEFWVKDGKVFRSPLGNKGKHGYILQEVDEAGNDIWSAELDPAPVRAPFGWVTIRNASEMFPGSIIEVPPRPYGRRGGVSAELEK